MWWNKKRPKARRGQEPFDREKQKQEREAAEQALKTYLEGSLRLQDSLIMATHPLKGIMSLGQHLLKTQPMPFPMVFVWVDITNLPEYLDIARVHQTEGGGDSIYTWGFINEDKLECYFVLYVQMLTPVQAEFYLPIYVREWSQLIDVISQTGRITLLPGPPPPWRETMTQLSPQDFMERIMQAGGEVSLIMAEETKQALRQHYEDYIERMKEKFERLLSQSENQ